ncbi:histidine phosphatase family protein [Nocardioides mesophilus]|uniref:Histidine phosphatase family protein n=1 Tax=Nocardioides mesophilus TaxID=433659 RepID=A0A7G9R972_9ACTN|nr:histidine phosphatase family protein [Nocardioides mesophilus]QNN52147.1 histidine phosphatase family protein [Nocardioides mesophilus]
MPRLHLVRHGRSAADPATAPDTWGLDPAGRGDLDALRDGSALPRGAVWFSSPEAKALETACWLTDTPVTVVPELAEHRRGVHWFADQADFRAAVRRAFARPEERAVPQWEPLSAARDRLVPAVRTLLAAHPDDDVVLVGHGTAWTLLVSELTGRPPDLEAWAALRMPDVWEVPRPAAPPDRPASYGTA